MQTEENQKIMAKLKRVSKMFHKLTDQIEMLTNIMDQHNNQPKQQEPKPEIVITDETSVEVILTSNEQQPDPQKELQQEARKLIQRFYYHIQQKMEKNQVNQIEALQMILKNKHKEDPYRNLFEGFRKLFFGDDLQCKVCQIKLQSDQMCKKHAKNDHLNDLEIYICVKCKTTFQKLELLEKHIYQEHNQSNKYHFHTQKKQKQQQPIKNQIVQKQNQKLDISQYSQQIQSQPILKKVFVPNKNSSSSEKQQDHPIFNQVYTGVENLDSMKNQQEIVKPKKSPKLKIKIMQPQKTDSTIIN